MKPVPLLFVSDSPELPTGLGRICRDLATQAATLPQFRVGVFGRGGIGSTQLPFAQYHFDEQYGWGAEWFEQAWRDFSRGEQGVVLTIWDISRLTWFARPRMGGALQQFLTSGVFQKWGYFPIDSTGIGGKLTGQCADALKGFNRVLAYTPYGKQIIEASGCPDCDWLPHGYNGKTFQPRDKAAGRAMLGVNESDVLAAAVMTNQSRKDWGTAFAAIAKVKDHIPNVKFWVHTDIMDRHWNIRALADDFGLGNTAIITMQDRFTSEQLSYLYSACDVTMLPSLGEGWGFPLTESLACGVPVIHTNYAAGPFQIPFKEWLVEPSGYRLEGPWNNVRPVLDPEAFANALVHAIERMPTALYRDECTRAVEHLKWENLFPSWKRWLLAGLEGR